MQFIDQLNRWFNPWRRRILLMVGKAVITAAKNSTINTASIDLMAQESARDIEMIQQYGFTSVPTAGAEAVVVAIGGDRSNLVIIATDGSQEKPEIKEGESAQYNKSGEYVKINLNKNVALKSGVYHTSIDNFINLFLQHTHLSGAPGSPTSPITAATPPILPADFQKGDD